MNVLKNYFDAQRLKCHAMRSSGRKRPIVSYSCQLDPRVLQRLLLQVSALISKNLYRFQFTRPLYHAFSKVRSCFESFDHFAVWTDIIWIFSCFVVRAFFHAIRFFEGCFFLLSLDSLYAVIFTKMSLYFIKGKEKGRFGTVWWKTNLGQNFKIIENLLSRR